jgi:hypothetical protein
VIADASTISFQTRSFARNVGFLWAMAVLPALLFTVTSTNAQSCLGNPQHRMHPSRPGVQASYNRHWNGRQMHDAKRDAEGRA